MFLTLILLFISIVGIIWAVALLLPSRTNVMADRLEQMKVTRERRTKKREPAISQEKYMYVTDLFPAPQEKRVSRYRNLLVLAGFRSKGSARAFYGFKIFLTVSLPAVFVFTGFRFVDITTGVIITALLAFIGFFAVDGYLSYKVRTRQERYS